MKFEVTNEELEALRYYLNEKYITINQLLTADSTTDVALFFDEKVTYNKEEVEKQLNTIIVLYELMQKIKKAKNSKETWSFIRGTNILEIERLKNETYIDRFISATTMLEKAENEYSIKWDEPVVEYICAESDVAYINVDEILGIKNEEVIISPFTKITNIKEIDEIKNSNTYKKIRNYTLTIENQKLEEIPELEEKGLYEYILNEANNINDKLSEILRLQRENVTNYENIRKLEQLLVKYDDIIYKKEEYKDYTDSARQADLDDIERITKELNILKETSSRVFDIIKDDNNFIINWKKNIAVYIMSKCKKIEDEYAKQIEELDKKEEEIKEVAKEIKEEKIVEIEKSEFEKLKDRVEEECKDNINLSQKILADINNLISAQQKYAKIASELSCTYSALNNAFEMRNKAEKLNELVCKINEIRLEILEEENEEKVKQKLEELSKVNLQISTLINYLNNPKSSIGKSKINRFSEMQIIEENELKRNIFKASLDIRGEAELKKLRDDTEIIEEKSTFQRILGMFTGRNKLDDFLLEQIDVMESTIRATLSKNVRLDYNYSIHTIIAEINMFIKENEKDELVSNDVVELKKLKDVLKKNFKIDDVLVEEIIYRKESKNMPIGAKVSRKELIEIETYRFLNKYGYDNMQNKTEEKKYYDTTSNEISRIIDYINTSGILKKEDLGE